MTQEPLAPEKSGRTPKRHRSVRGGVLLVLLTSAATLLAACSGSSGSSGDNGAGPSGPPKSGGNLTVALASSPDGLDPGKLGTHVAEEVSNQMYAELVAQSATGDYVPWLATSWSSNADATVWTLNLKHGVTFQDGTPFNAAAVCFNFDRAISPALKSQGAGILLAPMKSCAANGDYTVTVTFKQGYEPFLNALTTPLLGMASPTAIKAQGTNFNQNPVKGGSGPFEFVKWVQNDEIQLKRWAGYSSPPKSATHQGAAYLDSITFKIVPQTSVRMGAVTSKQYDAAETLLPSTYKSMKANSSLRTYVVDEAAASYQMQFNTARAPWDNVQMRTAVRDAMNIPSMLDSIYFGIQHQAWSSLAPNVQYYDSSLEGSWSYDKAKSEAALEQQGWTLGSDGYRTKQGKTLSLLIIDVSPDSNSNQEVDTVLQQQLKQVGIKVSLQNMTQAQQNSVVQKGQYDLVGRTLGLSSPNVLNFIFNSAFIPSATSFGFNWAQVNSPEMDQLLAQGQATTDNAKLASIYKQAQQLVATNVWTIPLYVVAYTFVTQANVHGVTFEYAGYPDFYSTSLS